MGWFDRSDVSSDVKSVLREDGKTDTYFGGVGKADGPGHGHVVCDDKGNVEYAREAGEKS